MSGRIRYLGTFPTREEAEQAVLKRLSAGTHEPPGVPLPARTEEPTSPPSSDTGAPTLRQWAKVFLKRRREEGRRNLRQEVKIWRKHVALAHFYDWPIDRIATRDVRAWLNRLGSGVSEATGRPRKRATLLNVLNALRAGLTYAVDDDLIPVNPARGIKVRRTPDTEAPWTWLTLEEIDRIERCREIEPEDRSIILFTLYTGLRAGECFGLRWEDVDLRSNRVTVRRSYDGPTKGGKVRTIPLFAPALAALIEHGQKRSGLVFPNARGTIRRNNYSSRFRACLRLAGISRRVRFHDCRHSTATHLASGSWGRAWTLEEIQQVLGHSTIHMAQRYAHFIGGGIFRAATELRFDRPEAAE